MDALPAPSSGAAAPGPSTLLNQPIVIDNGTHSVRAGYAGGSSPRHVVPSLVGRAKHVRVMPGGALEDEEGTSVGRSAADRSVGGGGKIYVGRRAADHRGAMILKRPMDRGAVADGGWEDMERLWEHVFSRENLHTPASEHPLLLTEVPFAPQLHRDRSAEILFETMRVPALHHAIPAVLSLYASGRTTGVVLDVGHGCAHAVPVYEGHALPHSAVRTDVAGGDVAEMVRTVLRRSAGYHMGTSAEAELAGEIAESTCSVSLTALGGAGGWGRGGALPFLDDAGPSEPYVLPDGNAVQLTKRDRQLPAEVLFDPSLMGSEEMSVSQCLLSSVSRSDVDLRSVLLENVVLAGGSTLLPGFGARCLADLRASGPPHARIRISAPPERVNSAWIGGSILASLATFKNVWVTRAEWEEAGSSVWQRRGL